MKKLLKSDKNSFTLLETLISILILSIVIVGFSQNSYYDNFDEEFMLLNKIENSYKTKNYDSNFFTKYEKIQIKINDTVTKEIDVKAIIYKDETMELIKYEL